MSKFAKERQDNRMKDYKSSFNADDFKKRREESIISIRRQRREENILKRRNMDTFDDTEEKSPAELQLGSLPDYVRDIASGDINAQLSGVIGIRRLLSIQTNPPIDDVINAGVIPSLVGFLSVSEHPKLQFEAAWALTNVASGTTAQTLVIINAGAVPAFVGQLQSPEVSVREQAVWALGNIAGDSYKCRDQLLFNNVLQKLLPLTMENNIKPSLKRNAVWTISNLCRGKPSPPFNIVSVAIPYLAELIKSQDAQIVTDASWALSYLSDGDNAKIQAIIDANIAATVVLNLTHQSGAVQTPSLRIVGNIVTGDDSQTQVMIDHQALPRLKFMLENPNVKKAIKKEVCWTISNITAGNASQIQAVVEANVFESLAYHLQFSDYDVRKEAAWAIANATSSSTEEQIYHIVSKNCLKPLCDLLETNDPRLVAVALEAIENILQKSPPSMNENPYSLIIEDCSAVSYIEKLQLHANQAIADKANEIISKFFSGDTDDDDDDDDDNSGDDDDIDTSNDDFSFGVQSNSTFSFA